jgi:hypothetical protein
MTRKAKRKEAREREKREEKNVHFIRQIRLIQAEGADKSRETALRRQGILRSLQSGK